MVTPVAMNFDSISSAVEFYQRGVITRNELFGVALELAASGSVGHLLSGFPSNLQKELSDSCLSSPAGRENWLIVQSVCVGEASEAEAAAYTHECKER